MTIIQQPDLLHPADNHVWWVFDSPLKNELGYRYYIEVIVDSEIVARYSVRPSINTLLGEIDISKALTSLWETIYQDLVSYDAVGHYIKYSLDVYDEYFQTLSFVDVGLANPSNWPNFSDLSLNPQGVVYFSLIYTFEPPYQSGDIINITQTGATFLPQLEGTVTVVDVYTDLGFWFVVVKVVSAGKAVFDVAGDTNYANGLRTRVLALQTDTLTAYRGAESHTNFINYNALDYAMGNNGKFLTTLPDGYRIDPTAQTKLAIWGDYYNFWVFADWGALGVTDEATFIAWVEANSDYTVDNVTDFSLVGDELKCNIFASGGFLLTFISKGITEVKAIGNGFQDIEEIFLYKNDISNFNPIIPLPTTLLGFGLSNNNISDWDLLLPWITAQPAFTNPCKIYTAGNPTSAIGTTFETIANTKNATIIE